MVSYEEGKKFVDLVDIQSHNHDDGVVKQYGKSKTTNSSKTSTKHPDMHIMEEFVPGSIVSFDGIVDHIPRSSSRHPTYS